MWRRFCVLALFVLLLAVFPAAAFSDTPAKLHERLKVFHDVAPEWVARGGNAATAQKLGRDVDAAIKAGDIARAYALLGDALRMMQAPVATSASPSSAASSAAQTSMQPQASLDRTALDAAAGRIPVARSVPIPKSSAIIFHRNGYIFVADADGKNQRQITFDVARPYEHVAASPDRKYIVANYFAPQGGEAPPVSRMVVYDLLTGKSWDPLPGFHMAGNGGVDWGADNFLYFAGVQKLPYPKPKTTAQHIANAEANDIYRARPDGGGVQKLTKLKKRGEADVSVSEDGSMIAYMATRVPDNDTEIWVSRSDGSGRALVYKGGINRVSSVHDPELSPDNRTVVFSQVNPDFRNFPAIEAANTAHDIFSIGVDGKGLKRLTQPGPISIVPDIMGDKVLFVEMADTQPPWHGLVTVNPDGSGYARIVPDANIAKWLPPAR